MRSQLLVECVMDEQGSGQSEVIPTKDRPKGNRDRGLIRDADQRDTQSRWNIPIRAGYFSTRHSTTWRFILTTHWRGKLGFTGHCQSPDPCPHA
jgi:hypothetical protein